MLPFCGSVTTHITRVLNHKNIRTVTCPAQKITDCMGSVKDPLGLHVPGVYQIPCACGKSYIGQTGRMVTMREQEHMWHLRLDNLNKSAVTQHGWDAGHEILVGNTKLLCRSSNWQDRIIRESMEISLAKKHTLNQEEEICLSKAWMPALRLHEGPGGPLR